MTFILKGFRNQDQNNICEAPGWSWEVTLEWNTVILLSLLLLQSNTDGCCTHLNLHWRLLFWNSSFWACKMPHLTFLFCLTSSNIFNARTFLSQMHSAVDSKSDKHTCWWSRCSSSWAGSRSWAPRRRAVWSDRKAPTRCGWPRGTWRQCCPESSTCRGACVSCGWCPADPPAPSSTWHTERRRKKDNASHRKHFLTHLLCEAERTMMEVRSSLSKRLMASSRDL